MCGCSGNVNREVRTSAQVAAEMAAAQAEQAKLNAVQTKRSTNAAIANANA